jgi:hypothetical protein
LTSSQASPVTICIPSNRPLALAKGPLESAIRFAADRNYRVVIADNSGEGAKLAYFSNLPAHVVYLFDETRAPVANLLACLEAAETEFVLPMGDDDFIEAIEGQPAFDFSALGSDVAGVRPMLEVFAVGEGVLRQHSFAIEAESAADRMYEYRQKLAGDNTLYYSYFRRDDFREILTLLEGHPIATGDMDWALVYALVANGKVLADASTRFRYDIGKWRWTEGIEASIEAIYQTAGLPREAIAFEHLFRFLDSYVFAFRRTFRLPEMERIKSLYAVAVIFLGHTLHTAETQPQKFAGFEREIGMLRAALKEPDDYLLNVFDVAAQVAERLRPGLHEGYIRWFAAVRDLSEADQSLGDTH